MTVTASDGSSVTLTASDGTSQPSLAVAVSPIRRRSSDRPAFLGPIADVYTTMNTPVTFPIPVVEGDAGVPLAYGGGDL